MRVSLAHFLPHVLMLSALSVPGRAFPPSGRIPDELALASLEQRASEAPANEQCYLYAQLVHGIVEYSADRYVTGDSTKATGMLKRTKQFTHKIRSVLAGNSRKLKDTQILLRRSAFLLKQLLHSSRYEDRPLLQETLVQLNQTEDAAMMQVFKK